MSRPELLHHRERLRSGTCTPRSRARVRARAAAPAAAIVVLGSLVLAWLCDAVGDRDGITAVDRPVAAWFASHRTPGDGQAGLLLARATGPAVLVVVTVALAVWLLRRGRRLDAQVLAVGVVAAYAAGGIAKVAEHRARPGAPVNLAPEGEPSFPSGHVLAVATLVGILLLLAWGRLTRSSRVVAIVLAVAAVLAVSVDRLVVGAHWLTDVLGSLALSAVVVGSAACVLLLARPRAAPSEPGVAA